MELKKYVYYHTGAGYVDGYDNLPEKRGDDWRNLFTAARKQYGNNDGMLYVPTEGGGFVMLRAFKGDSVTVSALSGGIEELDELPLAFLDSMKSGKDASAIGLVASRLSASDRSSREWAPKLFDCIVRGVPAEVRTKNFDQAFDTAMAMLSLFPLEFARKIGFAISESPFADAKYIADYEERALKPALKLYYGDAQRSNKGDVVSFDLVKGRDNFNEMGQALSDMAELLPVLGARFKNTFAKAFAGGEFDSAEADHIAALVNFDRRPDRATALKLLDTDDYAVAADWLIDSLGKGKARDDALIAKKIKTRLEGSHDAERTRTLTAMYISRPELMTESDVESVSEYIVGAVNDGGVDIKGFAKKAIASGQENIVYAAFDATMLALAKLGTSNVDFANALSDAWKYANYYNLFANNFKIKRDALFERTEKLSPDDRLLAAAVLMCDSGTGRIAPFVECLKSYPDPYAALIEVRALVNTIDPTEDGGSRSDFVFGSDRGNVFYKNIIESTNIEALLSAAYASIDRQYTGLTEAIERRLSDKPYVFGELDKLSPEGRNTLRTALIDYFGTRLDEGGMIAALEANRGAEEAENELIAFRNDFVDGDPPAHSAKSNRSLYFKLRRLSPIALTAFFQALISFVFLCVPVAVAALAADSVTMGSAMNVFTEFFEPVFVIFPLIAFCADIAIYFGLKSGNRLARANKITFLCCVLPMLCLSIGWLIAYFLAA